MFNRQHRFAGECLVPDPETGEPARKRVIVCVEAERSLREGREIPLTF